MGCLFALLEVGYFVLGWNYSGFGGSTGASFLSYDVNVVDVVVKYALYRLYFSFAYVVVYGWFIGGFTVIWVIMIYLELGALVFDVIFDDFVSLVLKVMF